MSSTMEKQNLTEQDEKDITATTMLVFLAFIAGLIIGCFGTNMVWGGL